MLQDPRHRGPLGRLLIRLLPVLKWSGAAVCFAVFLAWAASLRWTVFTMNQFGESWGLKCGAVYITWVSEAQKQALIDAARVPRHAPWEWFSSRRIPPMQWRPWTYGNAGNRRFGASLSLWVPGCLAAAATALLFGLDRRPGPGRCPACGYDLSGSPAGLCPECGPAPTG